MPRQKRQHQPRPTLVGTLIRERREALGLSETELANRIGIPRGTLHAWENGQARGIPRDMLWKVAYQLTLAGILTTQAELLKAMEVDIARDRELIAMMDARGAVPSDVSG